MSNQQMNDLLLQSLSRAAGKCHPDCVRASNAQEDYDASQSAAFVAVSLISSARVIFKLDTEYTEYSAQILVDNADKDEVLGESDQQRGQVTMENILQYMKENVWNKKEDGQGSIDQQRRDLTVKDCLEFAFKKGLPRRGQWAHLGCTFKAPLFACQIPRVPMKGQVIEAASLGEAMKLLDQQPMGARLHVFSPEFDRVEEEGIYDGPSGNDGTRYVGLRDVMIVESEKKDGKILVTVQIVYKKKTSFVKVTDRQIILPRNGGDESQVTEPTGLLVEFCIPRFSVNQTRGDMMNNQQMNDLFLQSLYSGGQCHPDCVQANNEQEDYDASQSAAFVAVSLISSARVNSKLDSEYTLYSAQYLVDNAGKKEVQREMGQQGFQRSTMEDVLQYMVENVWHKYEYGQGSFCWRTKKKIDQQRRELTVKDCLEFAFKKGLPTREQWTHFGCTFEAPHFDKPHVPMRGEVIEATDLGEAMKLLVQQPVGARLHVFSPEFDRVGEEGIYDGPSGNDGSRYVGLRDVMIVEFEKKDGKTVVTVQIVYKKKTSVVKVSDRQIILPRNGDDESQVTEPTGLLVDFCIPRFSVN